MNQEALLLQGRGGSHMRMEKNPSALFLVGRVQENWIFFRGLFRSINDFKSDFSLDVEDVILILRGKDDI